MKQSLRLPGKYAADCLNRLFTALCASSAVHAWGSWLGLRIRIASRGQY